MLGNKDSTSSNSLQAKNILTSILETNRITTNDMTLVPAGLLPRKFNVGINNSQKNAILSGIPTPLVGSFTIAAEQIIDGTVVVDTTPGNVVMTFDSVANIIAAMGPNVDVGSNITLYLTDVGNGANTVTLVGGPGIAMIVIGNPVGAILIHLITPTSIFVVSLG